MSRQEDFIDAGIAYRMEHSKPMCIAGSDLADVERAFNRVISFEAGAEHGYQYAVDKACELIEKLCDSHNIVSIKDGKYKSRSWLEEQFRKAIEE